MTKPLTAQGRQTRERIVEATAHQVLTAGVGGTSLDDVRAATLTSKSQLFHYFPGGKFELIGAVAEWNFERLMAAQQPYLDDLSTARSWQGWRRNLLAYYRALDRWTCPIGALAAEAAALDAGLAEMGGTAIATWREALQRGIRRYAVAHPEADLPSARAGATAILAAIQGGLLLSQVEGREWPLRTALDRALEPFLAARSLRVGVDPRPGCAVDHLTDA